MNIHMRIRSVQAAVACVALLAFAGAATGCTQQARGTPENNGDKAASAAPPPAHGAVFLDDGECSTREPEVFSEVPCDSEKAVAQVIARHEGSSEDGPRCPARTDFVLHISEGDDGSARDGYACMRKLRPPHPGDPGGGGGPRTIVGDCVHAAQEGRVKETACDGSGKSASTYQVTELAAERSGCPAGTELYVDVGGSTPVGCARPYRG